MSATCIILGSRETGLGWVRVDRLYGGVLGWVGRNDLFIRVAGSPMTICPLIGCRASNLISKQCTGILVEQQSAGAFINLISSAVALLHCPLIPPALEGA